VHLLVPERLAQRDHQVLLRAPEVLGAELHHVGDAFHGSLKFELAIKLDLGWSKSHAIHPNATGVVPLWYGYRRTRDPYAKFFHPKARLGRDRDGTDKPNQ